MFIFSEIHDMFFVSFQYVSVTTGTATKARLTIACFREFHLFDCHTESNTGSKMLLEVKYIFKANYIFDGFALFVLGA